MEACTTGACAIIQAASIQTPELLIPVILGSGDFFVKTSSKKHRFADPSIF
ncbi:hypothetical protein C943_03704 [Mariniradius saccharolyticus AK6]|uniref:Uncharacterized protein n=1 Tax=Mariniradius saccharolyticus AK6 TaxID=1239962 RepID=M7XAN4_9BACT|nr:hypothetical protein C943_03704 [Mariniradius saccharolyticus AK6]